VPETIAVVSVVAGVVDAIIVVESVVVESDVEIAEGDAANIENI
jgi:hypothetical protein